MGYKASEYNYRHIPFDDSLDLLLDLDEICDYMACRNDKGERVLIFCKDGDTYSPGIAIAYLMYAKRIDLTKASLLVFGRRLNINISKKLYAQLLTYKPNYNQNKK